MPVKVKYLMRKESSSPFIAATFALISAVLLGVIFWPVFVQFLSGGTYEGAPLTGLTTAFYCVLIGFTLLFALFTALSAKHTLVMAAFCALPVSLFYMLDVSGLRQTILFFDADNVFHYYRDTQPVFRGWWFFASVFAVVIFVAARSFIKIALNKSRTKSVGFLINCLAAALWTVYAIIHIVGVELPLFRQGDGFVTRDFIYAIMYYLAGAFFFVAVTILMASVRKTMVGMADGTELDGSPTTGYATAGSVRADSPSETSYTTMPNPVQYADAGEAPPAAESEVYHADPDETVPAIDPHEPSAVVSIEQAEAIAQEDSPPPAKKKSGGKKKKAKGSVPKTETTE